MTAVLAAAANARLRPPTPVEADFVVIAEAIRLQTICMSHLKRKGPLQSAYLWKTSSVYALATSSVSLYLIRKQEQSAILTQTRNRFKKILPSNRTFIWSFHNHCRMRFIFWQWVACSRGFQRCLSPMPKREIYHLINAGFTVQILDKVEHRVL